MRKLTVGAPGSWRLNFDGLQPERVVSVTGVISWKAWWEIPVPSEKWCPWFVGHNSRGQATGQVMGFV